MAMRGPSWLFLVSPVLGSAVVAGASCGGDHRPPADAAVDAGIADAGVPDAAITDAGTIDAPPSGAPAYFLVAEPPGRGVHCDSYVLPVTRPDDIEHARALIHLGPEVTERAIAVAHIQLGADGINRDLFTVERAPWSWHVTELVSFGDYAIELLDGWPGLVEMDPAAWMRNTPPDGESPDIHGSIGFWGYTVVEELVGYPESLSSSAIPGGRCVRDITAPAQAP
jgi:hypothetical protein